MSTEENSVLIFYFICAQILFVCVKDFVKNFSCSRFSVNVKRNGYEYAVAICEGIDAVVAVIVFSITILNSLPVGAI